MRIRRANPLAWPAGRAPGFDPAHPAANGSYILSFVPSGKALLNVMSGQAVASVTSQGIDGILGPVVTGSTTNTPIAAPASPAAFTAGGFVRAPATLGNPGYVFTTQGTTANNLGICARGGEWQINIGAGTSYYFGSLAIAVNTAYFFAFSDFKSSANWIIVNLQTGQAWSGTTSTTALLSQSDTGIDFCTNTLGRPWGGPIGPLMLGWNVALSLGALLAWAADPWAFWYPRRRWMGL
jgi:hypothetical protein